MPALTKAALDNGGLDLAHIAEIATSDAETATDRLGRTKRTLAGALAEFPDAYEHAAEAATQAALASIARSGAEAARDSALIQAGVYDDEPTGRAAVADGVAFKVAGSGSVAAYEYRRINAGASVLLTTYPSAPGIPREIIRRAHATVYDVADLTIMKADHEFTISTFRYGRIDGSFISYAPPPYQVFQTPEPDTYIVADCRGAAPVLSKGTRAHVWQEVPFLEPDVIILAYKESGIWHSSFVNIQKILSELKTVPPWKAAASTIYDVGDLTIMKADHEFTISTFRYGRADGSFISYAPPPYEVFQTPEPDTYIVADCRGQVPVLSKGTRSHVWEEVPFLERDIVILAYKESSIWHSGFINIQKILNELAAPPSNDESFVEVEKVVRTGGVVGIDCDHTDIKSALDAIVDNSRAKRYVVRVMNGEYDLSDNGFDCLGFKNHVILAGQTRHGVRVIKRDTAFSSSKAGFDPMYYGESIEYAALRNMTVITKNCKAPVHIDGFALQGLLEVVDCTLLNEEPSSSPHYELSLAVGLRKGQIVKAINCHGNGQMYAHTSNIKYVGAGCEFHLINCIFTHTDIGDLGTYGLDKWVIKGCKFEYATYVWTDAFGLRNYAQPSIQVEMSGNEIEYVNGLMTVAGQSDDLWGTVFGGKFGITDASIHSFNTCPAGTIPRGGLVALSGALPMAIKPWSMGEVMYGVAMDDFTTPGDFGVVQYAGTVFLNASGATPIVFGDAVELDAGGIAVKHGAGRIIGHARQSLDGATAQIKVKLI